MNVPRKNQPVLLGLLSLVLAALSLVTPALAVEPQHSVKDGAVHIEGVGRGNPIVYDNDWWKDVPDAAYLWAKASLGEANLRGNIVSRDMWDWQKGYKYKLEEGIKDARSLLEAARKSGLKNIPDPVEGASEALVRPESGRIEETKFTRSPGSKLIVAEAHKASPEKPLVVFAGGPCTTVAAAYLDDPSIAGKLVVFQIDGGGYNGKDSWSWEIAKKRLRFVNWARGYFWGEWSQWKPEHFQKLPKNPLGDTLRKYASSDLGKANQWGDGAWIFALFAPRSISKVESWDGEALTVPKGGTNVEVMEQEFFATMTREELYRK